MRKVGLTGGIGSGKSTIARILAVYGIPVYNSDRRAHIILNTDSKVRSSLISVFGERSYINGTADRRYIAEMVFTNRDLLDKLNRIVHPVVTADFMRWTEKMRKLGYGCVILESAILFESGFDVFTDFNVTVSAPESLRVERTCVRDNIPAGKVMERIESQASDRIKEEKADFIIRNGKNDKILPQVSELISKISNG